MEQVSTDDLAAVGAPHGALEADIDSPALRALLAHWQQRRGERPMPARRELAEEILTQSLGELILFELSCANCAEKGESSPAGAVALTMGMATPYHEVMRSGQPMYRRRAEAHGGSVERLLLPLSRDGFTVDAILVGVLRRR